MEEALVILKILPGMEATVLVTPAMFAVEEPNLPHLPSPHLP